MKNVIYLVDTAGWLDDHATESSLAAAKKTQKAVQAIEDAQTDKDCMIDVVHIYRVERLT